MKFEKLLQKIDTQLSEIKTQHSDILNQANLSILACKTVLSEMNHLVLKSGFNSVKDEIQFFKKIKIRPLGKLIYFSKIYNLELKFPKASIADQKKYIKNKIRKINKFFDNNVEFVQYVKERNTHLDEHYYIRANCNALNLINSDFYFRTPEFSTSHDLVLGKIKGFDLYAIYLQNRLYNLKNPNSLNTLDIHKKSRLRWTSSKVALTELIYALHSVGAINSGAADIKEMATLTERIFNVELGDFYRTFLEIRNRKTTRTKFLEKLTQSLTKRMDDIDD